MNAQQIAYKIAFGNALNNSGRDVKLSKENGKWTIKIAAKAAA